jgi:hypothetical protein
MTDIHLIDGFQVGGQTLDLAVIQGKTYQLSFNYPGDLTGGTLCGEIRNGYLQDNGLLLGEFNFLPMSYGVDPDSGIGKTTITAQIQANVTALLPYTKYQGINSATSRNCWVYDIEHTENDVVRLISRGLVQVKPEVTLCEP